MRQYPAVGQAMLYQPAYRRLSSDWKKPHPSNPGGPVELAKAEGRYLLFTHFQR